MDKEQRRRQIEHQFRETARKEVEGRTMGAKIWRQALEECDGDEEQAREHYIKLRIQNLRIEFRRLAKQAVQLDREQKEREGKASLYQEELKEEARQQRRSAKKRQGESDLSYIAIMLVLVVAVIAVLRTLTAAG
ncbi:MAG: hypothetical protein R3F19_11095 [Verrucomicrobiales bacterium]|nr:hypothetical protein [Verrucomicrobiae bacterium]